MTVALATEPVNYIDPAAARLKDKKVIVIGSGPVGMRFVNELLKRYSHANIQLFGNEPYQPYNRVQLSAVLAGEIGRDSIDIDLPSEQRFPNFSFTIASISSIDTIGKAILDANNNWHSYDYLIIATGARSHKPNIEGIDQTGVYTFRNLKDTDSLYSRISRSRHTVVVGGGLLGLEAARGLLRHGTRVTVVQQGGYLMNQQLDDTAAAMLQAKVEQLGINVVVNVGVGKILGEGRVTGVQTRQNEIIECDTVLLCAGIKPNIKLALEARIKVGNGVVVDDHLQTSAENVFAIGECCEHNGLTYGLVSPGYEQAAILANYLTLGNAKYVGSQTITRLKVVGESVCSMGEVAELPYRPYQKELTFGGRNKETYRKLVLLRGKIIGAVSFGEWPEQPRIQEAFQSERSISLLQQLLFRFTGRLWSGSAGKNIADWPDSAVVCQCNNISLETLKTALESGVETSFELSQLTTAGTVCGSCQPLLANLCGEKERALKDKSWLGVLVASIVALIMVSLVSFLPAIPVADSVQQLSFLEQYWNDKFWKQVTGFSLLGMSALGLLMSIKKRWLKNLFGEFTYWRLLHAVLGVFCVITLVFHTGLHLGENLNLVLILDFLAVLTMGGLAGLVIAVGHTLNNGVASKLRSFWSWLHILVSWPLPLLLALHILSVYYF